MLLLLHIVFFFFFNDTATTEIYTLSLHDALPIYPGLLAAGLLAPALAVGVWALLPPPLTSVRSRVSLGLRVGMLLLIVSADRKSTRLNSSHSQISYAVFCLKKKKKYSYHTCRHTS